jgi:hypothetical protein
MVLWVPPVLQLPVLLQWGSVGVAAVIVVAFRVGGCWRWSNILLVLWLSLLELSSLGQRFLYGNGYIGFCSVLIGPKVSDGVAAVGVGAMGSVEVAERLVSELQWFVSAFVLYWLES